MIIEICLSIIALAVIAKTVFLATLFFKVKTLIDFLEVSVPKLFNETSTLISKVNEVTSIAKPLQFLGSNVLEKAEVVPLVIKFIASSVSLIKKIRSL